MERDREAALQQRIQRGGHVTTTTTTSSTDDNRQTNRTSSSSSSSSSPFSPSHVVDATLTNEHQSLAVNHHSAPPTPRQHLPGNSYSQNTK